MQSLSIDPAIAVQETLNLIIGILRTALTPLVYLPFTGECGSSHACVNQSAVACWAARSALGNMLAMHGQTHSSSAWAQPT